MVISEDKQPDAIDKGGPISTTTMGEDSPVFETPDGDGPSDPSGGMMTLEGIGSMDQNAGFNAARVLSRMDGDLFEMLVLADLNERECQMILGLSAQLQISQLGKIDEEEIMRLKAVLSVSRSGRARSDVVAVSTGGGPGFPANMGKAVGTMASSAWQRAKRW